MLRPSCGHHDCVSHIAATLLVHYSIMTPTMTLRRFGCALCMPYIAPYQSQFRPYNRAYAYRGLPAFALLSMAGSVRQSTTYRVSANYASFWIYHPLQDQPFCCSWPRPRPGQYLEFGWYADDCRNMGFVSPSLAGWVVSHRIILKTAVDRSILTVT